MVCLMPCVGLPHVMPCVGLPHVMCICSLCPCYSVHNLKVNMKMYRSRKQNPLLLAFLGIMISMSQTMTFYLWY